MRKLITTMLIAITIFTLCSGVGSADEHIVQPSDSIQDAVNSAASGDVIIVKPGTYSGIIEINKENLTIRSESGNPEDTVIQANSNGQYLFWVRANNTTISGFKVTAGGKTGVTGIRLSTCNNCTITDNRADSNTDAGINLVSSKWNTIFNNTADSNKHGIVLEGECSNNYLTSNHVNSNTNYGFYLTAFSSNNSVNNNIAQDNSHGFYLINSSMNVISGNDVSNNTEYGMWITHSNNNTISGNTANETSHGISLDSSDGNTVFGNIVSLNNVSGLYMCRGSDNNTVFNNYLNNILNANIQNYNNTWNTTKTAGKNIIGGPYIAGNFWAEPDGTGFSESATDSDLDGIADKQYAGTNFIDYQPLVLTSTPDPILPVANFSSNPTEGYVPLSVQFTDQSQNATSWYWDFGDGASSTNQNATHTYSTAGTYTVNLAASNINGTNSKSAIITVNPQPVLPVANFSSNESSGYAPLFIEFTDSSLNATGWNWDFDDGNSSTEQNPVHVFSTLGSYTVNLTVINGNGTDSIESIITVLEAPAPVIPVANFSSNISEGYAPLDVQFNDSSLNATSWNWDFGDENSSTEQNPLHTFSSAGDYTVNLIASNDNDTSSKSAIITVLDSPDPILPIANFSSNVSSGYAPLDVQFTDTSLNASEWYWDFDDGSTSTNQNPVHVFSTSRTYTVNLTVKNDDGTNSTESIITVTDAPVLPVADFNSNVSEGSAPLTVQFTDNSENENEWYWDFDDGSNSIEQNPVHVFSDAGTYTVNLTVRNDDGNDSKLATISVYEKVYPVANFSSNVSSGFSPLSVQFTDLSQNATEWNWDFENDGTIDSTDRTPLHTYSAVDTYTVNLTVSNVNGTNSTFGTITVLATPAPVLPIANFSSNVSSGYAPLDVQFNDSSLNATAWNWDFGDGNNSTVQNPINIYSKAGNYTVNLTMSNANGTNSTFGTINVSEPEPMPVMPVANFSTSVTDGYVPLSVTFTDLSQNATSISWDVNGDGFEDSNASSFVYEYASAGTYTAKLTAINLNGTNSSFSTITVNPQPVIPVANFSSNVSSGYAPLDVQFNDSSENATRWNWDFGDGSSSTDKNATHTYSASGNYTVNLTVGNENGTNSTFGTINVSEPEPIPVMPVANFSSNVTEGYEPLDVQFTDSSKNANEWYWDFGDGNSSTEQNPLHTFSSAGDYTVNLIASNDNDTSSKSAIITVLDSPDPILPVANFSSNVSEGSVPLDVQFNDSSENSISWYWDFGDSTNSTEQNPLHTYSAVGTYPVNLTAINVNGANSSSATITVLDAPDPVLPVALFSSNVSSGYAPLSVKFTDSSENATSWDWAFGDGNFSTEQNPLHTYSKSGTYTVNLTVMNVNGTNSSSGTITVLSMPEPVRPVANFSSNVSSGYAPLSVQFTDRSKNATGWNWDFNDGSSSTEQNPLHTYSKSGTYTVNLTARNVNGTDYKLATIYVLVKPAPVLPVADFGSNTTEGYAPLDVQFTDRSKNATGWNWDFENDGKIDSTARNPLHTYSSAGIYIVNLTVINANGADSTFGTITVLATPAPVLPVANFRSNVSEGYAPLDVQFTDSSKNATGWNWDFGDGSNSKEQNPLHTFSKSGNYTVNLTASNVNGTNSKLSTITVLVKSESVLPVADFGTSVTGGYAPLSVTFTDLSQNAASISWDVNGDGAEDSNASSFTYEYASAGTYTAKLTAVNANGTDEKTTTIDVDDEDDGGSSHSSGSRGGGGGGGSPEPAKNVEVKEISQVFITHGNHVKFNFPKNVTAVVYLSFDPRKTAGKTTTIVEMLKNQSTLTPDAPQGEVYSYLNIWVGNGGYATEKNIENATVCFRVKKSWMEDKDIDWSSIILNRYSDKKWNELPTTLLGEDSRYLYFVSETPGFSPFAITAEKAVIETLPKTESSEQKENIELDIEKNTEQAENTGVSQEENLSTPASGVIYFIVGLLGALLLGGFLYRRDKLK